MSPRTATLNRPEPAEIADVITSSTDSIFGDDRALDAIFTVLDDAERALDEVARADQTPPSAEPSTPWVLCVDDDQDFTATLRRRLHGDGISVVTAGNGLDGFQMAFTNPASAIVLDYNLPNGAGDYVLQRLKRNPLTTDIPVIVLTGNRDRALQRRMLAGGATAFLTKPVDYSHLLNELRKHIPTLGPA